MTMTGEDILKRELKEDEQLLWSGKPTKKFVTKNELIRIPASLLLIGFFAYYWLTKAEVGTLMEIFAIAATLYVIYTTVVKLFIKQGQRERTYYGLTDSRILMILVKKDGSRKKIAPVSLSSLKSCTVSPNKDGTGSLLFSEGKFADPRILNSANNWSNYPLPVPTAFFDIENPEAVKKQFQELVKESVSESGEATENSFSKYDE